MFPDKNPNFALFSALDPKFPRMKIKREHCPAEFFSRPDDFKKTLYVAQIDVWEKMPYPLGRLVENLGDTSDIGARTRAVLSEKDVDTSEFSEAVLGCLPQMPFIIPPEEYRKRRDFTKECIFTIDPLTARYVLERGIGIVYVICQ